MSEKLPPSPMQYVDGPPMGVIVFPSHRVSPAASHDKPAPVLQLPTPEPDELLGVVLDLADVLDSLWLLCEAVAELPENPNRETLDTLRWVAERHIRARAVAK